MHYEGNFWRERASNNVWNLNTHLLVNRKEQIKPGRFRQRAWHALHDRQKALPKVNPRRFRDLLMQIWTYAGTEPSNGAIETNLVSNISTKATK